MAKPTLLGRTWGYQEVSERIQAPRRDLRGRLRAILVGAVVLATMVVAPPVAAAGPAYAIGDVFAGVGSGQVKQFSSTGTLLNTLTGVPSNENTGMAFDTAGNLYSTGFNGSISKYDNSGTFLAAFGSGYNSNPESIVRDAAGNFYVGQAGGTGDVLKFDSAGGPLGSFNVATDARGSDWIDLAADQCTLFYTSEGSLVKRYNVCTDTQLADFATLPSSPAYALRIRPNGEVLVAASSLVHRLDSAGAVVQSYTIPSTSLLFALNLDPDGTSFWTGDIFSGEIFRVDIATGAILQQFNSTPNTTMAGLAVFGEITVGGGGGGPTEHPGTVPEPFACGTYVRGGEDSGVQLNPADLSYSQPSPLGISGAGVFADHHWVHSTGTSFVVFDMGAPVPAAFYVPSIDHGPIPGESMEATLYGTNSLADAEGTWEAGTISDIYVQGVDAAWISDDYSTRWTFSQPYRYIGILHGGPGALVRDGDAEIDAVCAEGTRVTVTKFYDANANGVQDNGETGIANWQVSADSSTALTDAAGQAAFVLQAGANVVSEGTPVQTNWLHTTPASVNIIVPNQQSVSFGNVCVGAGGALSKGFWGNKNGKALFGSDDLALMVSLNLRNANGTPFNPGNYAQFNTWLQAASATNMANMLSAQLAAMELNVFNGLVSGSSIVDGGSTLGFITINNLMAAANTELGLHGLSLSGSPYRSYQEALKNALDRANNNLNFIQARPCAFGFAG